MTVLLKAAPYSNLNLQRTQKKTQTWGRKLHESNHHAKREDTRYNRVYKTTIHLRHRLIKGCSYTDVCYFLNDYSL